MRLFLRSFQTRSGFKDILNRCAINPQTIHLLTPSSWVLVLYFSHVSWNVSENSAFKFREVLFDVLKNHDIVLILLSRHWRLPDHPVPPRLCSASLSFISVFAWLVVEDVLNGVLGASVSVTLGRALRYALHTWASRKSAATCPWCVGRLASSIQWLRTYFWSQLCKNLAIHWGSLHSISTLAVRQKTCQVSLRWVSG